MKEKVLFIIIAFMQEFCQYTNRNAVYEGVYTSCLKNNTPIWVAILQNCNVFG